MQIPFGLARFGATLGRMLVARRLANATTRPEQATHMSRWPEAAASLLVALASLHGCGRPGPTAPAGSPAVTVPAPAAAASAPRGAGPAVPTGAEGRAAHDSSRGRVRCGESWCRAEVESCCDYGDVARCVSSVPPGPRDEVQPLAAQIEACNARVTARFAMQRIRRCDDSSDCGPHEMCCEMWMYSGATRLVCRPLDEQAHSACDYGEACTTGLPCRTAGTECIAGRCRKANRRVRCAGRTCSTERPACCGEPGRVSCRTRAECRQVLPRYECASPRDCAPGERCQLGIMGTVCQGLLDTANLVVVCDEDADCPEHACPTPGRRARCLPDGWLRTCRCSGSASASP